MLRPHDPQGWRRYIGAAAARYRGLGDRGQNAFLSSSQIISIDRKKNILCLNAAEMRIERPCRESMSF